MKQMKCSIWVSGMISNLFLKILRLIGRQCYSPPLCIRILLIWQKDISTTPLILKSFMKSSPFQILNKFILRLGKEKNLNLYLGLLISIILNSPSSSAILKEEWMNLTTISRPVVIPPKDYTEICSRILGNGSLISFVKEI